jgi:hypothetical protein
MNRQTLKARLAIIESGRMLEESNMSRFHELEMAAITGEPVSLSKFQDNLCLIVNVASR